jgi:hypothetical protein
MVGETFEPGEPMTARVYSGSGRALRSVTRPHPHESYARNPMKRVSLPDPCGP